jgi:hypothetical protein
MVTNILPPILRGTGLLDWISGLTKGLQYNLDLQAPFSADVAIRALFSGQHGTLQAALNYVMNTTGILITTNTSIVNNLYIYNEAENLPTYFYNEVEGTKKYIFNESETPDAYDFTVKVPVAFYTTAIGNQIQSYTNLYKLAGKSFNIITY